jgi:hypothetical protein
MVPLATQLAKKPFPPLDPLTLAPRISGATTSSRMYRAHRGQCAESRPEAKGRQGDGQWAMGYWLVALG